MERLCYNCGNALNSSDYCNDCKLGNNVYSRLEAMSNALYNRGLELSKLRDLSNAIKVLRKSLSLNKNNVDTRNLLGLIYFETGETVLALEQWVISKNIRSTDNLANHYLELVQKHQANLDKLNTAIVKYNQAIKHIQQGSYDLGTIQLKKVVSINHKFIKAYLLLSLCYVEEGNNSKAVKTLNKVLQIDSSNFIAKKYLSQLTDTQNTEPVEVEVEDKVDFGYVSKPANTGLMNSYVQQLIFIIIGGIIGFAIGLYLIAPSKINEVESENSKLETELAKASNELTTMTEDYELEKSSREALETENSELTQSIEEEDALNSELEKILLSLQLFDNEDLLGAGEQLYLVNDSTVDTHPIYSYFESYRLELSSELYNYGRTRYFVRSTASYTDAITYFELSRKLVDSEDYSSEGLYLTGLANYNMNQRDAALVNFKEYVEEYPDGNRYSESVWYVTQLE